jgi:hypothetical protein
MLRKSAKSNWTLEELGWELVPAGDLQEWDGLLTWFVEFLKGNQSHLADKYIRRWHRAALVEAVAFSLGTGVEGRAALRKDLKNSTKTVPDSYIQAEPPSVLACVPTVKSSPAVYSSTNSSAYKCLTRPLV